MLDNSNFLTREKYKTNLKFVTRVVDRLYDMGGQFAVVSFNDNPRVDIRFVRDTIGKTQLQTAVGIVFISPKLNC